VREVRFASLDLFDGTDDGMGFSGLAIPYGAVTTIDGDMVRPYDETFRLGAFAKTLRERNGKPVPLLASHDYRSFGIGYAEELTEASDGLQGHWRLSDVQAGRDAAVLVRDRVVTGLSIGFEPIKNRITRAADRGESRDLVERTEVRLYEVSLCQFPAYELAGVTGRSENQRNLAQLAETRAQLVDRFGRIKR
jgi:uncharacterized protein